MIGTIIRVLIGAVFVCAGLGIIGLQIFWFLQEGSWTSMSLIDLAQRFSPEPWLYAPQQWIGAHWVLSKIPTAFVAIVIGYAIVVADD